MLYDDCVNVMLIIILKDMVFVSWRRRSYRYRPKSSSLMWKKTDEAALLRYLRYFMLLSPEMSRKVWPRPKFWP